MNSVRNKLISTSTALLLLPILSLSNTALLPGAVAAVTAKKSARTSPTSAKAKAPTLIPLAVPANRSSVNSASSPEASEAGSGEAGSEALKGASPAEAWRKKPPQAPAPRPFQLPKIQTYKMENGLTVEMVEDHRFPFISLSLGFHRGSSQEPTELSGISAMTADLMTEGTTTRKSKEIASAVDFIGGGLAASSDYDYSILSGSALSAYSDRLVDLMSDCLLHPTFPEDELQLNKTNLIQELTMKRSDPGFLVSERFSKVVFGSHPYSIVAPNETSINRITQKDLIAYHDKIYIPNNAVMIVIGDFQPEKMKEVLAKNFGSQWKPGTEETVNLPAAPSQTGRRIYLVDRPGSVQTSIKLGNVGVRRNDPNYFSFVVMNQILGGASNARLFMNIREQKGYTYGAYSRMSARKDPGYFSADANVRTEVTAPSIQEFLYELERMRNLKVSDEELKNAKNYLAGAFQLGLETQGGLAQRLLEQKLFNLPDNYLETYADKVMAVNIDEVRASARKLIDTNNLVITAVGDAKKIRQDLELFAPVSVYDTQGKLSSQEPADSKDEKPKSLN